ncbi:MAG: oxaloacetate decarboxylase [Rhodopila sp.]|nr:oxaloacetate decarboxylase [Rhodopila sp.]
MQSKNLRALLNAPGIIRAPGAYDAWSAKCIAEAGFPAVYMTGYGVAASLLGRPDIGFASMTEMVAVARNMAVAVDVPVIADADNGYGGIHNVMRTICEYEAAGVAAAQLEDQVLPKRCGHMEGKELITKAEMVAKVRAAVAARKNPDFVIIARTDARAVGGFDEALDRVEAYVEAGADVIFFEAPQSVEEMRGVATRVKKPLLANMVEKGKTPVLTGKELEALGYKIVIYPVTALYAASKALRTTLKDLRSYDSPIPLLPQMLTFPEFNEAIGLDSYRSLEKSFAE